MSARTAMERWFIDDVEVERAAFEGLQASLREEQEQWSCAETNVGGVVSYVRRDGLGRKVQFQEISDRDGGEHRAVRVGWR